MQQDEERARQAILKLGQDWVEAVHHRDVDRLLHLVTDDVVFMPANAPSIVGRAAVEQAYRAFSPRSRLSRPLRPRRFRLAETGRSFGERTRSR